MIAADFSSEQFRLDRQLRIDGWRQEALTKAKIGVVGDDDLLASLFLLSASALGIGKSVVLAPKLMRPYGEIAQQLNSHFDLCHIEGFYTHPVLDEIFDGCDLIVDLSHYGIANKLLLEKGFTDRLPIVRGFCRENAGEQGFRVFTYWRGREWQELNRVISPRNFPGNHFTDSVFELIVAGIVLEEAKNILMGGPVSDELIAYGRKKLAPSPRKTRLLVVGAGALGVFVGLVLAHLGYNRITLMDADTVDVTNLNRQALFYDAVGESKAKALSRKLNEFFGIDSEAVVRDFTKVTDISPFDAVFDCVDNFESRIVISEKCQDAGKVLISGGTSVDAGQVVIFNPALGGATPAELLGLYDIVAGRGGEALPRGESSCIRQPDPSVIMTNQITAGFMVESYRMVESGLNPENIFYDSRNNRKIL